MASTKTQLQTKAEETQGHALRYFKNDKHKEAFEAAVKGMDEKDRTAMSVMYLLTADRNLWQTAKQHIKGNRLSLKKMRLFVNTEAGYTLFCCAKDILYGTEHLTVGDLSDANIVPPKLYGVICNAMTIRRYGLAAINEHKEKEKCGK